MVGPKTFSISSAQFDSIVKNGTQIVWVDEGFYRGEFGIEIFEDKISSFSEIPSNLEPVGPTLDVRANTTACKA